MAKNDLSSEAIGDTSVSAEDKHEAALRMAQTALRRKGTAKKRKSDLSEVLEILGVVDTQEIQ